MVSKSVGSIPKGRIIPFYLTEDGDVYPLYFRSMEELEMCGDMIAMVMQHKIVVDNKHPINDPAEKISIMDLSTRKTK